MLLGLDFYGPIPVFFSEPSHFGLSVAPIWAAFILNFERLKSNFNISYWFILAISTLLCFSSTLILSILFFLSLKFVLLCSKQEKSNIKSNYKFFFLAIILLLFVIASKSESFIWRVDSIIEILRDPDFNSLRSADLSVSSITIVNHFLSSIYSLTSFNFLGVGFNHYERAFSVYYPISIFNELSEYPLWGYLNFNDGSNNFNKLLTEFGFLFLLTLFYLVFKLIKAVNSHVFLLHYAVGVFIILTFIRGAGYFNAGYILALFVLLNLGHRKQ